SFFAKSIASKCRFRILVFHLKPHAAAVLESASPACLNASNCVFPVRICLNTISVNILSSSFVQPSCLFLLILFLLHHLYYYMQKVSLIELKSFISTRKTRRNK